MDYRYGIKECNEFFLDHRANTRCKGLTYNEFLAAKEEDLPAWVQRKLATMGRRGIYQLYYGSVKNFRPYNAVEVYTKYKSRNIIDPYAGWGGRLFGALSMGLNYTGFDTNTNLKTPYEQLIKKYNKGGVISINFTDSSKIDYSAYTYDTILTSPPYYDRELYEGMPEYTTKDKFEEEVIKPTLTGLWNNLPVGGVMALNVPAKLYKYIAGIFGEETEKLPYTTKTGADKRVYDEYTYVWIKTHSGQIGAKSQ